MFGATGPLQKKSRAFKTASGETETLRGFLNSAPHGDRPETLGSPQALARWMVSRGLLASGVELSKTQHRRALETRDALRGLLHGEAKAKTRFETVCGPLRYHIELDPRGIPRFRLVSEGPAERALGVLVGLFLEAQRTRRWKRLKPCQDCGEVFYDDSNNRTGKWCSHRCGERVRKANARRRKKALRGG